MAYYPAQKRDYSVWSSGTITL